MFFFFFDLFFVSNVIDFASLCVFIASLTSQCIIRFVDLKTWRAGSSIPPLRKVFGELLLSNYFHQKISAMSKVKKYCFFWIETLVHVQQSHPCVSAPLHSYLVQMHQVMVLFLNKYSVHYQLLLRICFGTHDDHLYNIQQ